MRIFHMADWHIGKLVNGFYMTEDQEYVIEELCKAIEEKKPDVLIIAGDLYDRAIPPVHAVELLNKSLIRIVKDLNIKVIALAGNHDSNERIEFASSLLSQSGLYMFGNLKRKIENRESKKLMKKRLVNSANYLRSISMELIWSMEKNFC